MYLIIMKYSPKINKSELICLLCVLQYTSAKIYAFPFVIDSQFHSEQFKDKPASFSRKLSEEVLRGILVNAKPSDGCSNLRPPPLNENNETGKWIVLMPRYTDQKNCSFEQKVRSGQSAGYDAVVVYNVNSNSLVAMKAKNHTGIDIPAVFVSESSGLLLKEVYADPKYLTVITGR